MSNSKWVIVGAARCSYCLKARHALEDRDIPFTYFAVDHPEGTPLKDFLKACGLTTVPQIYINGQRLGGWDELKLYLDIEE